MVATWSCDVSKSLKKTKAQLRKRPALDSTGAVNRGVEQAPPAPTSQPHVFEGHEKHGSRHDEGVRERPSSKYPWDGVSGVKGFRAFAATTTVGVY